MTADISRPVCWSWKKPMGWRTNFFIKLVAQIGDRREADVLDLHDAEIFGHRLDQNRKTRESRRQFRCSGCRGHEGIQIDVRPPKGSLSKGRSESVLAGFRTRSSSGVNISAIKPSAMPTSARAANPAASRAR